MTHEPTDTNPNHSEKAPLLQSETEYARYGAFNTSNGSVVIYDEQNSQAWIQSDSAVDITERE